MSTETRCSCVSCDACQGSGHVWFDFRGQYLGNRRTDDLDQLELCEECGGNGLSEVCGECQFDEAFE